MRKSQIWHACRACKSGCWTLLAAWSARRSILTLCFVEGCHEARNSSVDQPLAAGVGYVPNLRIFATNLKAGATPPAQCHPSKSLQHRRYLPRILINGIDSKRIVVMNDVARIAVRRDAGKAGVGSSTSRRPLRPCSYVGAGRGGPKACPRDDDAAAVERPQGRFPARAELCLRAGSDRGQP